MQIINMLEYLERNVIKQEVASFLSPSQSPKKVIKMNIHSAGSTTLEVNGLAAVRSRRRAWRTPDKP